MILSGLKAEARVALMDVKLNLPAITLEGDAVRIINPIQSINCKSDQLIAPIMTPIECEVHDLLAPHLLWFVINIIAAFKRITKNELW